MKAIEARDGIHIPVAAGEPLNSRSGVFNSSTWCFVIAAVQLLTQIPGLVSNCLWNGRRW
eukprot:TRINITY_DN16257_c0_g1_i1.p1 TRINITY_DN16257_c0_g1~~TRINITY_DN16257_c0_g1_i1.p1  ORF type:complete len:60 (-),score=11.36 TRINITY_DN16257_c0_g1_i1:173-352(-)